MTFNHEVPRTWPNDLLNFALGLGLGVILTWAWINVNPPETTTAVTCIQKK